MPLYSASYAKLADQFSVASDIFASKILQQPSALSYHCKETSSGVIVMLVCCEMIFEPIDTSGQQCDLYFRGAGITFTGLILGDYFVFLVF